MFDVVTKLFVVLTRVFSPCREQIWDNQAANKLDQRHAAQVTYKTHKCLPWGNEHRRTIYNTPKYEYTTNAYSEKFIEDSPINRVLEIGAPGTDWLLNRTSDDDHTIKTDYLVNINFFG